MPRMHKRSTSSMSATGRAFFPVMGCGGWKRFCPRGCRSSAGSEANRKRSCAPGPSTPCCSTRTVLPWFGFAWTTLKGSPTAGCYASRSALATTPALCRSQCLTRSWQRRARRPGPAFCMRAWPGTRPRLCWRFWLAVWKFEPATAISLDCQVLCSRTCAAPSPYPCASAALSRAIPRRSLATG